MQQRSAVVPATALRALCHFIDGRRVEGQSNRFADVYNPTLGVPISRVPLADDDEVDAAIASAHQAFKEWSTTSPIVRGRGMARFKTLIEQHMSELADLVSTEHGKGISDARRSIQRGLEVVEFCEAAPHLLKGEFSDSISQGIDVYSMRQPLGVVVNITPFNFPAMVPLYTLAPAIAAGNTVVLKPSERDPSCPLGLAELLFEAGAPAGVVNVINGDKSAVDRLIADSRVHAVSFVGSTPVAKSIFVTAAMQGKRVQAFGGAKNHMIILPHADIDEAAGALMGAAYGSAGERCVAISVAVPVTDEVADRLVAAIADRIPSLKVGSSFDAGTDMGPLITRDHLNRVKGYIGMGVEEGARHQVRRHGLDGIGATSGWASKREPGWSPMVVRISATAVRKGSSWAPRFSTMSNRVCASTRRRFSVPSCPWCAQRASMRH